MTKHKKIFVLLQGGCVRQGVLWLQSVECYRERGESRYYRWEIAKAIVERGEEIVEVVRDRKRRRMSAMSFLVLDKLRKLEAKVLSPQMSSENNRRQSLITPDQL